MNPYAIIAALVFWLGSLAGVGWWQFDAGKDVQAKFDQAQFDKINADLSRQKTIAAETYRSAQATIIQTLAERDKFKTQLETDHAQNLKTIDDLRNKYAGIGLRFTAQKDAGCGAGSPGSVPPEAGAPRIESATVIQLPDPLAANLHALAFDADALAVEYKKCYEWATND